MFGKIKWLAVITLVLLFIACDLDPGPGGGTTPGIPTNVKAVPDSSTAIKITWNTVTGATDYDVYVEVGSTPIRIITVQGTSHTHTGLQPNTTYNYYISAKNKVGESGLSNRASAITLSK